MTLKLYFSYSHLILRVGTILSTTIANKKYKKSIGSYYANEEHLRFPFVYYLHSDDRYVKLHPFVSYWYFGDLLVRQCPLPLHAPLDVNAI
jgi:hypothetical protein